MQRLIQREGAYVASELPPTVLWAGDLDLDGRRRFLREAYDRARLLRSLLDDVDSLYANEDGLNRATTGWRPRGGGDHPRFSPWSDFTPRVRGT